LRRSCPDIVITGIISACHRDVSLLFDPSSTFSYVPSYFSSHLSMHRDSLYVPVSMSMTVWNSIIGDRVYRSCGVTINGLDIVVDLMLFDMVDFEVILGMEWLSLYHAI